MSFSRLTRFVGPFLTAFALSGRAAFAQSGTATAATASPAAPAASAPTPAAGAAPAAGPATTIPVTFFGEVRTRSELDHPSGQTGDAFTYLRSRRGVRVDPAPRTRIVLQVQDSRVFGTEGSAVAPAVASNQLDLHQGYLQVGGVVRASSLTLRAGRQEIALGNERLVGAANWTNLARSFDGARILVAPRGAVAGAEPWTATAFVAVVNEQGRRFGSAATSTRTPRDHTVGGAYLTFGTSDRTTLDATMLLDAGGQYRAYDAADRGTLDLRLRVPRISSAVPLGLELEGAYQAGHQMFVGPASAPVPGTAQSVRAWLLGARVKAPVGKSTLTLGADALSGDDAPADDRYTAFSTLYATNHPFYGLIDVIGDPAATTRDRGLLDLFGSSTTPLARALSIRAEVHRFALATGTERPLGWEADVVLPIKLNAAASVDVGAALFRAQRGAEAVGIATNGTTSGWTYLQLVVGF
jgi:hypothetical protein